MAAPRATQFIALRNLSHGSTTTHHQVRTLHMTSPATYASPILTKERPVLNLPRDIAGLRAECKRRKISATGTKQDLVSRLNADELTHARAFSTDTQKRPTTSQIDTATQKAVSTRHFNTSRTLKAVNDNSTIDFAYLPSSTEIEAPAAETLRVPILPNNYRNSTNSALEPVAEETFTVMKPEISTMSADAVFLPMSDLTDGHAMNVDFHALADRVAQNLRRMKVPVEEQAGCMKQIWGDLVDDMLGGAKKNAA